MNEVWRRIVVDSNVLISRLLFKNSTPGKAVAQVLESFQLLVSDALLDELRSVLLRTKFDPYASIEEREQFLAALEIESIIIPITCTIDSCRDPKDNMILELAISGKADLIITGDQDLLSLGTFRSIAIVTPAQYLHIS